MNFAETVMEPNPQLQIVTISIERGVWGQTYNFTQLKIDRDIELQIEELVLPPLICTNVNSTGLPFSTALFQFSCGVFLQQIAVQFQISSQLYVWERTTSKFKAQIKGAKVLEESLKLMTALCFTMQLIICACAIILPKM